MGVPPVYITGLYVGLILHFCSAAVVVSEDGLMAEEENLNQVKTDQRQHILFQSLDSEFKITSPKAVEGVKSVEEVRKQLQENLDSSSSESKSSDEDSTSVKSNINEDKKHKYSNKSFNKRDDSSSEESSSQDVNEKRSSLSRFAEGKLANMKVHKRSIGKSKSSPEENTVGSNGSSKPLKNKATDSIGKISSDESSGDSINGGASVTFSKINNIKKRSVNSNDESINEIDGNPKEIDEPKTTITDSTNPITETTAPTTTDEDTETQDKTESSTSSDSFTTTQTTEATAEERIQTETAGESEATTKTTDDTVETTVENQITTEETKTTENDDQSSTTENNDQLSTTEEIYKVSTTTEANQDTTTEADEQTETVSDVLTTSTTPSTTEPDDNDESKEDKDEESTSSASTTTSTEAEPSEPEEKKEPTFTDVAMARVNRLSDQIRLVLYEFRKTNVVVIPGQSFFPDPMDLQDFQQAFSIGTMNFMNMKIYGLSEFTVEHINTDVDKMQVYCLLHMRRLVILGNYTLRTFFSRAAGPFNVTLLDVDSEGVAEVASAPEGHLEATDSDMDMSTKDMKMDFRNMGFFGSMFKGVADSVGDVIFNSIKPQILEKVNVVIRNDVNKKLKDFSVKFINKVAPVDLAISEGRKYVRDNGYDPYRIKDHTFILGGLVYVNITEFVVKGLAKFHRIGNLSLSMDKGTIEIGVHVATQQLSGTCDWSGQTFGIVKYGKTNFTVHHLQARALVTQSLDIRKKPQLAKLDLELGYVRVTMDSPMTLTYMIEGVINAFPRLIRHIIVDALEKPLKEKVQELLNKINVESLVDENLPRLDSFGL